MEDCLCLNREDDRYGDERDTDSENAVYLHVYDLDSVTAKMNAVTRHMAQSGVFHVGVQVYSDEWSYGQHDDITSGVTCNRPKEHLFHVYRETVFMGDTDLSRAEVWLLLERLKPEWPGNGYHLFHRNCISFADALCIELGVRRVPEWILRLPRQGAGLAEGIKNGVQTMRDIDETLGVSSGLAGVRSGVNRGLSALGLQNPAARDEEDYDLGPSARLSMPVESNLDHEAMERRRCSAPPFCTDRELIERMSRSSDHIPLNASTLKAKKEKKIAKEDRLDSGRIPNGASGPLSHRSMTREREKERYRALAQGIEKHSMA